MSKIICDVCGTSYPDTAEQCPICGCARADITDSYPQNAAEETSASGTYTYVKGGRFSKANVRKRNLERQLPPEEPQLEVPEENEDKDKSGKGLVFVAIALLLAIIGVVIYIIVRFMAPADAPAPNSTEASTNVSTTVATTEATEMEIFCTELELSNAVIELDKVGAAELLDVTPVPGDTTDTIQYASADESVATVDSNGKVVAVGPGQTTIIITCGDIEVECKVVCTIETEPTEETTEPTEPTETSTTDFELNRDDFSLFMVGETWNLYTGSVSQDEITWSTADESVATVENGVVKAVAPGYTTITAEYRGTKHECVVRCQFTAAETEPTQPSGTPDNTNSKSYSISATDVTISIGESFTLTLKDENGEVVPVSWSFDASVCSVSGNTVTGVVKSSQSKVSTFYNGVAYECIVRVIE